jgi:hypothetical protein
MVTLASPIIRCVASTVSSPDIEIDNPTSGSVAAQVVTLTPPGTVTLNTTDDAFQVLSDGTIAFKTDLPTATTKQINMLDVLANQYPVASPVTYSADTNTATLSNEYYTVTVRKTQNLGTPLSIVNTIVPATGTVSLTGTFTLSEWKTTFDSNASLPTLSAYTFEIIEQGPLVIKVKATYTFSGSYYYGAVEVFAPDSARFYSETIELRAGVDAVFFENDSNFNWMNGFDVTGLNDFDQFRYRGHFSTSVANGYTLVPPASAVSYNNNATPNLTAIKDITAPMVLFDGASPSLPVWGPFDQNTGRLIIARDSSEAAGQYVGIAGGPASRALGVAASGVTFSGGYGTTLKMKYYARGRADTGTLYSRIRYPWMLTIGDEPAPATDSATILEPGLIWNQQVCLSLTKLARYVPASPSETFYTAAQFMTEAQLDSVISRMQSDSTYRAALIARDGYAADLINYIATPTSGEADALYDAIVATYESALDAYWLKNGYHQPNLRYTDGASTFAGYLERVQLLMASSDLTTNQKSTMYKMMLFFGFILADGEYVPLANSDTFGLGTANQVLQFLANKDTLLLALLGNSQIVTAFDAAGFEGRLVYLIEAYISSYGSSKGSPHYTGPGVAPTLNLVQQAQVTGTFDAATEVPRLALFAQFMLDLLTPKDARFEDASSNALRKVICFGDGSLEGTEMHGTLGTIFAESNPTLSKRLMEAWFSMNWPHTRSGTYQSSVFKIDDELPRQALALTDAHYPDYMTVFRSGFDTANESAVWFLHGNWSTDHRDDDSGAAYFYFLGTPIGLDWSAFYDPNANGSIMHNGLTLVAAMTWNGTDSPLPSLYDGSGKFTTNSVTYTPSSTMPSAQAVFDLGSSTTWTRTVTFNKEIAARPVLIIDDATAGTNAANEKIMSLNLMMTGAVVTPAGNVTPTVTLNAATSTAKVALSSGWSTFEFTGQWGVNVILMVYSAASGYSQLGAFKHDFSPGEETAQYLAAVGSAYSEMQYQFRLWSTANSKFVLVPWLASGSKPTVSSSGMDILVDGDTVT